MASQAAGFQLGVHRGRSIAVGVSIGVHLLIGFYVLSATFHPFRLGLEDPETPPMSAETVTLDRETPPPPAPARTRRPVSPRAATPTGLSQVLEPLPLRPTTSEAHETLALVALGAPGGDAALTLGAPALGPRTITDPEWLERPGAREFNRVYPEAALRDNVMGSVTLTCEVTVTGTVRRCAVASENPVGYGFGRAALSLSGDFRMKPRTEDGAPVDGAQVRIPVRFTAG